MNSHVIASKATKSRPSKESSTKSEQPSLFSRVSRLVTGSKAEASAAIPVGTIAPAPASQRSYGFATKKAAMYTDKTSEDLYKFKNLSSDYMRSASPTREDEDDVEETNKSKAASSKSKKNTDDKKDSDKH